MCPHQQSIQEINLRESSNIYKRLWILMSQRRWDGSFFTNMVAVIKRPYVHATFKQEGPPTVYTVFNNTTPNFVIWLVVVALWGLMRSNGLFCGLPACLYPEDAASSFWELRADDWETHNGCYRPHFQPPTPASPQLRLMCRNWSDVRLGRQQIQSCGWKYRKSPDESHLEIMLLDQLRGKQWR